MHELIWVGNTLLPRWFVFGCFVLIIVATGIIWAWITKK